MRVSTVAVGALFVLAGAGCNNNSGGPITSQVEQGLFIEEVRANGRLVSIGGVEICCDVEHPDSERTRILWMVSEGTFVRPAPDWEPDQDPSAAEPPDLLVRLDSSIFESRRIEQKIVCNESQARLVEARSRHETAVVALKGFKEIAVEAERKALEAEIAKWKADQFDANDLLERGIQAFAEGILSRSGLDSLKFKLKAIERQLKVPQDALAALDTRAGNSVSQFKHELTAAKAQLDSVERNHQLNLNRLADVETRIEACTIRAPEAGQVLHATVVDRRTGLEIRVEEGMAAYAGQTLLSLWNREDLGMTARIPEASLSAVQKGMQVDIRFDAFPDSQVSGVVDDTSLYPAARPASGMAEYETTIRLTGNTSLPLRPGLTGEARIILQRLPSALKIPKDAVLWRDKKAFCLLYRDRNFEARQVELSGGDGTICAVSAGLEAGEEVVRNAQQYSDKVNWP